MHYVLEVISRLPTSVHMRLKWVEIQRRKNFQGLNAHYDRKHTDIGVDCQGSCAGLEIKASLEKSLNFRKLK